MAPWGGVPGHGRAVTAGEALASLCVAPGAGQPQSLGAPLPATALGPPLAPEEELAELEVWPLLPEQGAGMATMDRHRPSKHPDAAKGHLCSQVPAPQPPTGAHHASREPPETLRGGHGPTEQGSRPRPASLERGGAGALLNVPWAMRQRCTCPPGEGQAANQRWLGRKPRLVLQSCRRGLTG